MDSEIEAALAEVSDDRYESLLTAFQDKIGEAGAILFKIYAVDHAKAVGRIPEASLPVLAWTLEDLLREDLRAPQPTRSRALAKRLIGSFYGDFGRTPRVVELIGYIRHPRYLGALRDRTGESLILGNVGSKALTYLEEKLAQHGLRFGMLPQQKDRHPSW